jgi:hypothetical protein
MGRGIKWAAISAGLALVLAPAIPGPGRAETGAKPGWQGSIKVEGKKGAELVRLAKLPLQRAIAIAIRAAKGGKTWKAELEVEKGFLVYTVQVITPGNEAKEYVIDAGNAAILAVEEGDVEELGAPDKAE